MAELLGLVLVGYGIWFAYKGLLCALGEGKDWWRPLHNRKRYPYPAAGVLLGLCLVLLGAYFALNNVWPPATILGYIGGGLFVVVLVIGVAQPRFLHPKWYGRLWDRFGKEGMARLKRAAYALDDQEWAEVNASPITFGRWVDRVMPRARPSEQESSREQD